MIERGILFSAPMVRALLAGTKSVTRRLLKPRHDYFVEDGVPFFEPYVYAVPESVPVPCPYGEAGDRLFVKETWATVQSLDGVRPINLANYVPLHYCADHAERGKFRENRGRVRPSIFMPRWASRITLDVVSVRCERLHEITEEEAKREGVEPRITTTKVYPSRHAADVEHRSYRGGFEDLWGVINGAESWATNPYVWRVEFKRVIP